MAEHAVREVPAVTATAARDGHARRAAQVLLWLLTAALLAAMALTSRPEWPAGWDARVYARAIQAVRESGDPYAAGLAAQKKFHAEIHHVADPKPFSYVYGPVTIPLLRALGVLPPWLLAALYAAALLAGQAMVLRAAWQMAEREEQHWLPWMLPFVCFFPGLLLQPVMLSGNVMFVLYGPLLAAAVRGARCQRWGAFYAALLLTAVLKPPLLTLLALPFAFGRQQRVRASAVGAAGVAIYAAQAWAWPRLFAEYQQAVRLQFDWNGDFGFGPAGVLAQVLYDARQPFQRASTALYLVFAVVLFAALMALGGWLRRAPVAWRQWLPIALMGAVVMNPRVKEYDVAAIAAPMLLAAWRQLRWVVNLGGRRVSDAWRARPDPALLLAGGAWFALLNYAAVTWDWKSMALAVLLGLFFFSALWLRFAVAVRGEQ